MTEEQKAAYIQAKTVAAYATIQGMMVTNRERASKDFTEAYDEEAFLAVENEFGISENHLISLFVHDTILA